MRCMFSFPIQNSVPRMSPNPFLYPVQVLEKFNEPSTRCIKMNQLLMQGRGTIDPKARTTVSCCAIKSERRYKFKICINECTKLHFVGMHLVICVWLRSGECMFV